MQADFEIAELGDRTLREWQLALLRTSVAYVQASQRAHDGISEQPSANAEFAQKLDSALHQAKVSLAIEPLIRLLRKHLGPDNGTDSYFAFTKLATQLPTGQIHRIVTGPLAQLFTGPEMPFGVSAAASSAILRQRYQDAVDMKEERFSIVPLGPADVIAKIAQLVESAALGAVGTISKPSGRLLPVATTIGVRSAFVPNWMTYLSFGMGITPEVLTSAKRLVVVIEDRLDAETDEGPGSPHVDKLTPHMTQFLTERTAASKDGVVFAHFRPRFGSRPDQGLKLMKEEEENAANELASRLAQLKKQYSNLQLILATTTYRQQMVAQATQNSLDEVHKVNSSVIFSDLLADNYLQNAQNSRRVLARKANPNTSERNIENPLIRQHEPFSPYFDAHCRSNGFVLSQAVLRHAQRRLKLPESAPGGPPRTAFDQHSAFSHSTRIAR